MGDIADMLSDVWLPENEWDDFISHLEENLSKCQWENKDGQVIKFRKMETFHIKNCIAYIKRKRLHISCATFSDYLDAFEDELERRENEDRQIRNELITRKEE